MSRAAWLLALAVLVGACSSPISDGSVEAGPTDAERMQAVIAEMEQRLAPLEERCDHRAVFAGVYFLTTVNTEGAVTDGSFDDGGRVVDLLEAFAAAYFAAYDGTTDVPEAWAIAFEAADAEEMPAIGDAFLGMNAHISRDLPFVLADVWADLLGPEQPPTYRTTNDLLEAGAPVVIDHIATTYDSTAAIADIPLTDLDAAGFGAAVTEWRSEAWTNGYRLVTAESEADRDAIAAEIETAAADRARLIRSTLSYPPVLDAGLRADRRAFCESA